MEDFEYYGLFLSEGQYKMLRKDFGNIIDNIADKVYLNHCTLLHKSQLKGNTELRNYLECHLGRYFIVNVTGIGISDKAIAFKVDFLETDSSICANAVPHITIATYNGGKPVDSNDIKYWKSIPRISLLMQLRRV